jgi:hypothetical protein
MVCSQTKRTGTVIVVCKSTHACIGAQDLHRKPGIGYQHSNQKTRSNRAALVVWARRNESHLFMVEKFTTTESNESCQRTSAEGTSLSTCERSMENPKPLLSRYRQGNGETMVSGVVIAAER